MLLEKSKKKMFLIEFENLFFNNHCLKNSLFNKNCFINKVVPKINFKLKILLQIKLYIFFK